MRPNPFRALPKTCLFSDFFLRLRSVLLESSPGTNLTRNACVICIASSPSGTIPTRKSTNWMSSYWRSPSPVKDGHSMYCILTLMFSSRCMSQKKLEHDLCSYNNQAIPWMLSRVDTHWSNTSIFLSIICDITINVETRNCEALIYTRVVLLLDVCICLQKPGVVLGWLYQLGLIVFKV